MNILFCFVVVEVAQLLTATKRNLTTSAADLFCHGHGDGRGSGGGVEVSMSGGGGRSIYLYFSTFCDQKSKFI